tara:strand:+ start:696 stop:1382 length:687 start_codon:yes stop_codon:yes gene_type:complete
MIKSLPHILCIDDDDKIRGLLRVFLKKHNFRVSLARNASDANSIIDFFSFDLLILDIMMPKTNGITFLRNFRKVNSKIPVLMLTADNNLVRKTESFLEGCDDYLIKPFEPYELVLRINKLLNPRVNVIKNRKSYFGDCEFDFVTKELKKNKTSINLTNSEQKLIELFSKNLNQEISREIIANELKINSNFRSIDVIVTRLRKKISSTDKMSFLRTIRGKGYMLISDYE